MIPIRKLSCKTITIASRTPGPAEHAETWIKFSENDTWHEYNIEGAMDQQALAAEGLIVEGAMPTWITPPYAVEIGTDVTSIENGVFSGSELTSVTIPSSVTSIESGAFSYCRGLTSLTIGNGVTTIGTYAFSSCSGITSVTIPESVTSIGDWVFSGCSGLTSVTIGNGVTSIGEGAFSGCSALTSVTIPDSVTTIGAWTFSGCGEVTSVTIGNGVTTIGAYAFNCCSGLTSVTFNSFTKNKIKSLTTNHLLFGEAFYDNERNLIEKSFTAICTDDSMTVHFSADEPAIITFTDL